MEDTRSTRSLRTPVPRKAPPRTPTAAATRKRRPKAEMVSSSSGPSKRTGSRAPKATPKMNNEGPAAQSPSQNVSACTVDGQTPNGSKAQPPTPAPGRRTTRSQEPKLYHLTYDRPVTPDDPLLAFHKKWSNREIPVQPTPRPDGHDNVVIDVFRTAIGIDTKLTVKDGDQVNSDKIDAIAYAMWKISLSSHSNRGDILLYIAKYSAMFSDLKLRTLAALNILPSWWFLRERAIDLMVQHMNCVIDDKNMQLQWNSAAQYCSEVQRRREAAMSGIGVESPFTATL